MLFQSERRREATSKAFLVCQLGQPNLIYLKLRTQWLNVFNKCLRFRLSRDSHLISCKGNCVSDQVLEECCHNSSEASFKLSHPGIHIVVIVLPCIQADDQRVSSVTQQQSGVEHLILEASVIKSPLIDVKLLVNDI